ncbi:MAG: PKD domain-containing protein, partial [candidate division Zixibacteria bacterium]
MTIKRLVLLFLLSALLTIAIQIGCDDLITEQITVTEAGHPFANFDISSSSPSNGICCTPCTVIFRDSSDGPRQIYIWTFGDGDSLQETLLEDPNNYEPPTHIYDSPGIYTVSLRIIDTVLDGEDLEIKKRFIYVGATTAGFQASADSACPGGEITFTPDEESDLITYEWNFGDGSDSSLEMIPTHIFADTGTFTVVLTATDTCSTGIDSMVIFIG